MSELDEARYVALTTFTRDGTPKSTPVWITGSDGTYLVTTGEDTWKVKRLANDPRVELRLCDARGRVESGATAYKGNAVVLSDDTSVDHAMRAVSDKYGWQASAARAWEWIRRLGRSAPVVAVRIELEP